MFVGFLDSWAEEEDGEDSEDFWLAALKHPSDLDSVVLLLLLG